MLMLKIILKNKKKYYFDTFINKKYFEKQPQPHFQINSKNKGIKTLFQSRIFFEFTYTVNSSFILAFLILN